MNSKLLSRKPPTGQTNGSLTPQHKINDTVDFADRYKSNSKIPSHLLEEARHLNETKNQLESRTSEVEKSNKLFESQLNQFVQYINSSKDLDFETKQRLKNKISEAEKLLDLQAKDDQRANESSKATSVPTSTVQVNSALEGLISAFDSSEVGGKKADFNNEKHRHKNDKINGNEVKYDSDESFNEMILKLNL